jgi:hypothetical protein
MFSQSRCLTTIGIHIHTDWWEGFMKYLVEVGSFALIYIPSSIKTGSDIQKFILLDTQTHRHTAW